MAAEHDDLPEGVQREVRAFAAVAGAQLMARGRSDIALFDTLIKTYQASGLLPA
jgi:TetR/AcrR family transcriptional repressor of nem operon